MSEASAVSCVVLTLMSQANTGIYVVLTWRRRVFILSKFWVLKILKPLQGCPRPSNPFQDPEEAGGVAVSQITFGIGPLAKFRWILGKFNQF
jgi:hypothetical protein